MARRSWARWIAAAVAAAALLVPAVIEAVYVTPTALFIDAGNRNGQLTLGNSSDEPEEVLIELKFGFVDTDSAGTPFVRLIDDPGPEFPSATDWLGVFPQRVRLDPGEKQVVRVFARPPADLPEGEYWSRLIITARPIRPTPSPDDSLARAGVSIIVRLVTSVTYRNGNVNTGLSLTNVTASVEGDALVAWIGMAREGNAAYLGTLHFELLDTAGAMLREWSTPVSVHVPITWRFAFPLEPLAPGDYVLRVRTEAARPDIDAERVLPAVPVVHTIPITVD